MKTFLITRLGTAVISALAAVAIPSRAALVPLLPNTPEVPGVVVPLTFPTDLTATHLLTNTVPFSIATNAYEFGAAASPPINICFGNSDQTIPSYLFPRYAANGATVGPCPTPMPFVLTGILNFSVYSRPSGELDYYFQIENTTPLSEGPGHGIFRLTIAGFNFLPSEVLQVGYTNQFGGSVPPTTADRDFSGAGELSFDFGAAPAFIGNPANVDPGETSFTIVVRGPRTTYPPPESAATAQAAPLPHLRVILSGAGTISVDPLPEPAAGLLAIGGAGILASARRKR